MRTWPAGGDSRSPSSSRGLAAGVGLGLAAAYAYTAAKFRRGTAAGLHVTDAPAPGTAEFARLLEVATAAPVRAGNRVEVLRNGDQTFPSMLDAIASAQETIDFSTYIYWPGDITERFTDAFLERARAGVEVRMILDGYGSAKLDRDHVGRLRAGGVRVAFFRPPRWYTLHKMNNRMHRRLLVVDGRVGFAGGVGIADVWTGDAQDPEHWRETHIRLEGPAVRDVLGGLLESWTEQTGEVPAGGPRLADVPAFDDGAAVQATRSSPMTGDPPVAQLFHLAIAGARKRLWLTTAYFTAGRRFLDALCDASARGVDVRILVSGREVDKAVVRKTGQHSYGRLLESGVRIFEYDRAMLHAKTLVVDDAWANVGSSNFDHRSFALDAELNVSLHDAGLAAQLADHFLDDLEHADELDLRRWRARPLRTRALELAGEAARQSF